MTISANYSTEYTRDQMIGVALSLARQIPAGQSMTDVLVLPQVALAAQFMNLEIQALQADGIILQQVERTTLTLTASTATYTLPADTFDVDVSQNDVIGMIVNSSNTEIPVRTMNRADYLTRSDKTVTGMPTSALLEQTTTGLQITFWPVPDSSAPTFRYVRVRSVRDLDSGAVTADVKRRWCDYLVNVVAHKMAMARSMPLDLCQYLEGLAAKAKARARSSEGQHGRIKMVPRIQNRWW